MRNRRGLKGMGLCSALLFGLQLCVTHNLSTGTALAQGIGGGRWANHPAVGAWFGKAEETCVGAPETNCAGLEIPAISLFMTPSFFGDGNFLGNDSLALGAPPFGPHTTAHGQWIPTSSNQLQADIVFMLPAPVAASVSAVHIKYAATVTSPDIMVGYVNIYVAFNPLPLTWEQLGPNDFPTLPNTLSDVVTPPAKIYTDQSQCTAAGCPLVFKFKVTRVAPETKSHY